MKTEIIVVENLKCAGCMNTITSGLKSLKGVDSVSINDQTSEVTVSGDEMPDRAVLAEKLDHLGYPEVGHNSLLKKAKSYVSCAVGRMSPEA